MRFPYEQLNMRNLIEFISNNKDRRFNYNTFRVGKIVGYEIYGLSVLLEGDSGWLWKDSGGGLGMRLIDGYEPRDDCYYVFVSIDELKEITSKKELEEIIKRLDV